MIEAGWDVAIGHGNGPQVGFILRRSEIASQGRRHARSTIGRLRRRQPGRYRLCSAANLAKRAPPAEHPQNRCHSDHPGAGGQAMIRLSEIPPSRLAASWIEAEAKRRANDMGWSVVEDAGRGWRRVVASPFPKESSSWRLSTR